MEIVADDLAKSLAEKGIKVTIITTSLQKKQETDVVLQFKNITLYSLKNTEPMKYTRSWWLKSQEFYNELEKSLPVDVIFSVSAAGYSISKLKNIPSIVFQAHGTALGEIKTKVRLNWKTKIKALKNVYGLLQDIHFLKNFDMIITIGNKVYNDIKSQKVFSNIRTINIDNAVDTELFKFDSNDRVQIRKKLKISDDSTVFISSSRLHPEKGILEAILIFEAISVRDDNVKFLILGDGPQKENLINFVKNKKLDNKVLFIGKVERDQLAQYYSASDCLLFTTLREEGLPLSLLEALSSSLVCFVSNKLQLSLNAPIFPISPKEPQVSAELIVSVIKEPTFDELKKQSSKVIIENYSKEAWVKKYIDTFTILNKEKVHAK
ncbi:glycosyltransferase family 4 protein [Paenibacillus sp. An7]|uniref:glycosyltransferase family 4 protein n=1 Tax=Paenibacillus sp. An7 TaxID=2689577 RepID=UPI001358579C|nr:glycosyltransferase family 4 protein [Paenibacillus sp. An7]